MKPHKITADKFIKAIIYHKERGTTLMPCEVTGFVSIKEISFTNLTIIDCIFHDAVTISKCTFESLTIEGCHFKKHLSFGGTTVKDTLTISETIIEEGLTIACSDEVNVLALSNIKTFNGVFMEEIESIKFLNINGVETILDEKVLKDDLELSIEIKNCNIHEVFEIENSVLVSISIFDSIIKPYCRFIDNKIRGSLNIYNSIFNKNVDVSFSEIGEGIAITKTEFKDSVSFDGIEFGSNSEFKLTKVLSENISLLCATMFDGGQKLVFIPPKRIHIENCAFKDGLYIGSEDYTLSEKLEIESFKLILGTTSLGDVKIHNLNVNFFEAEGINDKSGIICDNIRVKEFKLVKLANYSRIYFTNIMPYDTTSFFLFDNSYLGKAHFFNINLASFGKVILSDSNISEILFTNCQFPNEIFDAIVYSHSKYSFQRKRENYRQLKLALKNQGNLNQAMIFERQEMDMLEKSISWKDERINKFILVTNRLSNNHGQDWHWSIGWLLLFVFSIYAIIIFIETPSISIFNKYEDGDIKKFLALIFYERIFIFWQLLNPVHDINKFENFNMLNHKGIIYFLDFCSKLFSTYFVFQTISAFRKYLRK